MSYGNRIISLYASGIVTYCLAITAVASRFWARRLKKAKLWYDDWFILLALIVASGLLVDLIIWIQYGFGQHVDIMSTSMEYYFFLCLFIGEIAYTVILCLVKFSILSFYWRLFQRAGVGLPVTVLAGIVSCWGVAIIITSCLQCVPIQSFWDHSRSATCKVDTQSFLLGLSIPNILTDFIILMLPIPYVFKLQRRREEKFIIIGPFMLGGFICFASIMRLVSVISTNTDSENLTWDFAPVGIWTMVECNLAILSACLPSLRPVYDVLMSSMQHGLEWNKHVSSSV